MGAVAARRADAVVNSVGALQWEVSTRWRAVVEMQTGLLPVSDTGFAVRRGATLLQALDESMVEVTGSEAWAARD